MAIDANICAVAKSLHAKNMLAAADGNISYRLEDETIYITPSGVSKAFMKPDEIAVVNIDGEVFTGSPSSELKMHLKIYQQCPMAKAIVHAHPPVATAWTIARPELQELPADILSEVILACGSIPIVKFAFPGTDEMGENLSPYLPEHRVLLLAHHGALAWGETLEEAHRGMERLEHSAMVLQAAVTLGGLHKLPDEVVEKLKDRRKAMGELVL
ncbi:MAG: class II aldolase/adducin family protein [Bdellovibrionales bacterium]|nr:class II aldolase/adducin family protein [Bdellovibrionales bacterium]